MGDQSFTDLAVRLIGSLAVVVGLLLLIARTVNRRFAAPNGAAVQVVHRQAIGRGQSVAVVSVGGRVLVLGTTEQQVTLLTEVEPDEVGLTLTPEQPALTPGEDDAPAAAAAPANLAQLPGALAGSLLSPQTWRQAAAAISRRPRKPATAAPVVLDKTGDAGTTDFAAVLASAPLPDERAS
ncbi:flagellar biosynthetic protein FliO [Nocardioides sp.]|uniref:flagellar biosynthetic protein FliO n=1 Tax=Nocardioides sp. TaxID=35761 RepID=UPI00351688DD